MPKVYNKFTGDAPPGAVYIGRPGPWGNPFVIGRDGSRAEVLEKYRAWLNRNPDLVERMKKKLSGKDLVCWCSPKPCHGDVILEILNSLF